MHEEYEWGDVIYELYFSPMTYIKLRMRKAIASSSDQKPIAGKTARAKLDPKKQRKNIAEKAVLKLAREAASGASGLFKKRRNSQHVFQDQ
jgi:hypothetical protein